MMHLRARTCKKTKGVGEVPLFPATLLKAYKYSSDIEVGVGVGGTAMLRLDTFGRKAYFHRQPAAPCVYDRTPYSEVDVTASNMQR